MNYGYHPRLAFDRIAERQVADEEWRNRERTGAIYPRLPEVQPFSPPTDSMQAALDEADDKHNDGGRFE